VTVQKWHLPNDETVQVRQGGNVWLNSPERGSVRLGHVQKMHKREDEDQWTAMKASGESLLVANRADGVRWLIEEAGLQLPS
jgi:hypothetical protein